MVSFSSASSVEAKQADTQSCWIILNASDKAGRPKCGVGVVLWSQNTAYNPLCRLTEQLWEGGALGEVSVKPACTTTGSITSCVDVLAGHFPGSLMDKSGMVGDYTHNSTSR